MEQVAGPTRPVGDLWRRALSAVDTVHGTLYNNNYYRGFHDTVVQRRDDPHRLSDYDDDDDVTNG